MAKDAQESFLGGGGLALKFTEIGDNYTLIITEEPEVVPIRDYDDESIILTWPDGRQKEQMIVYGQLTEDSEGWSEDEDDSGERRLYVKGYMAGSLKDALKAAKERKLKPGGELYTEFTEEGEAKSKKHFPPKFFEMEYEAGKHKIASTPSKRSSDFENEEVDEDEKPAPRRGRAAKAAEEEAPAKGRGRSATATKTRGRAAAAAADDGDEEAPKPTRGRGRAKASVEDESSTVTGRSAARGRAAKASARNKAADPNPDDEEPPY